ncbi:MAG: hypothetical protein ABF289_00845 [Clostridiales bacterium]
MRFKILLYASIVFIGTAMAIALLHDNGISEMSSINRMQQIFNEKYKKTENYIQTVADSDFEHVLRIGQKASEKKISLLIYQKQ